MKLGIYPKLSQEAADRNKITRTEFEILLYGSEKDWFSQDDVLANVPVSKPTVIKSMGNLVDKGLLKIVRGYNVDFHRRYIITPASRLIVHWFYLKFNAMQPK